jgi:hypothetical protein
MTTINTNWVQRPLKAMLSVSQGVKKEAFKVLEAIEHNPSSFDELEDLPKDLALPPGTVIRKAKVINKKHDYRIVFLHRLPDDGPEIVDLLYVFKRKSGYTIDWDWIESLLDE